MLWITAAAHKNDSGADLVGINMEGPFIQSLKGGRPEPRSTCRAQI